MTHTSPAADLAGAAADGGTLRALEFAAIVEQLAALTSFTPSRELAEQALPMADPVHVGLLQDQTDEADRLLSEQAQASIGGARDIRAALERAGRGGRLTPAELLEIAETLGATERFAARLGAWRGRHLSDVRDELDAAPELAQRIGRSVDESGELLDSASAELGATRKRLRTAQDRVRERLNAMLRSSQMAGIIGEPIVTVRAGRYVIPIRAEAKGRVKGIVHDQSASGATLFIEPLTVVELNNAWTEATLAEAREEERILDELSAEVESRAESLRNS
ncbi:MAG TPA: endonuclease MutS2, partial [Candidatus Limnocylindria bacterium]|nr:endonuclease MutS2 [Candidatus Limnocylindria bacterium]